MVSDIIIVGAGVVGCALARVLSRYHGSITVLEKAGDVAEGSQQGKQQASSTRALTRIRER